MIGHILPRTPEGCINLANQIEDRKIPTPDCEATRLGIVEGLHQMAAMMMLDGAA